MKYKVKISDKFNQALGISDERNDELAIQVTKLMEKAVRSGTKADFIVDVLNNVKLQNKIEIAFVSFMAGAIIGRTEAEHKMGHLLEGLEKAGIVPALQPRIGGIN